MVSLKFNTLVAIALALAAASPCALAEETQSRSFGVGAVVVPRSIDVSTLPGSVQLAEQYIPGYARKWYIARINHEAGRPIDEFLSWSKDVLASRWGDQAWANKEQARDAMLSAQQVLIEN